MNKFIIASCIIALTFAWTTSTSQQCSCSDYLLATECQNGFGCFWTGSACQNVDCSAQTANCLNYPTACYLNTTSNTCLSFSSCSKLSGNNTQQCQAQNSRCANVAGTGTTCSDFSCTSFNSTTCPQGCFLNGQTCSNTPTCSSQTGANCALPYCALNGNTCQQAVCANYTAVGQLACLFVMPSASSVQPCYWNSTACVDASGASNLNSSTSCFINTLGAYHWSTANLTATDGSCKSCYGVLLQIVFAILLLLA
ncbi:unnamed protein product [Paramecium pentaurelia]|uniref:Uncharacterized protein n=1 Tax=Paramecium pentaurelia TaxID=43138 RepID=A0A8S1S930_9CILI|nr:unnamed protein product [Paramecium pentaurelia]